MVMMIDKWQWWLLKDNEDDNDDGENVNDDGNDDENDDGFTERLRRETARTMVRGRPGNIECEKVKNQ